MGEYSSTLCGVGVLPRLKAKILRSGSERGSERYKKRRAEPSSQIPKNTSLSFRVLESFPGARLAVFFPFFNSRVAREET